MAAVQVPCLVRMAQDALATNRCVVIGLQSTGEARTADVIAERGEELDEFVSGPKVSPLGLVVASSHSCMAVHAAAARCHDLCNIASLEAGMAAQR